MQGRFRRNPAVTVADYLEIIERKTASLFAAGARTAAHLAGAPPALVEAMARCGRHVGLAFQMSDDLLDVAGQPAVTGKPRGIDLRDGNPSLPIVLALRARPRARPRCSRDASRRPPRSKRASHASAAPACSPRSPSGRAATSPPRSPRSRSSRRRPTATALEALARGLVDRPALPAATAQGVRPAVRRR